MYASCLQGGAIFQKLVCAIFPKPIFAQADFQKYVRNRKPAYREETVTKPFQKVLSARTERLTTAEDDLLYCLLHDVRLGNSVAQVIEPSWLDTKVVAGRILAKILAEMLADGPLDISEMQDLLEEDEERFVFQNLLYQESSDDSDYDPINLANQCVSALFLRHTRKSEKILLHQLREPDSDNHSTNELRTQLKEIRISRKSPPQIQLAG